MNWYLKNEPELLVLISVLGLLMWLAILFVSITKHEPVSPIPTTPATPAPVRIELV